MRVIDLGHTQMAYDATKNTPTSPSESLSEIRKRISEAQNAFTNYGEANDNLLHNSHIAQEVLNLLQAGVSFEIGLPVSGDFIEIRTSFCIFNDLPVNIIIQCTSQYPSVAPHMRIIDASGVIFEYQSSILTNWNSSNTLLDLLEDILSTPPKGSFVKDDQQMRDNEQGIPIHNEPNVHVYQYSGDTMDQQTRLTNDQAEYLLSQGFTQLYRQFAADLSLLSNAVENLKRELTTIKQLSQDYEMEVERLRQSIAPNSLLGGYQEIEADLSHYQMLRKELKKRLRALEIQEARGGNETAPGIMTEIDDIRNRLNEVENKIKTLSFDLQNLTVSE